MTQFVESNVCDFGTSIEWHVCEFYEAMSTGIDKTGKKTIILYVCVCAGGGGYVCVCVCVCVCVYVMCDVCDVCVMYVLGVCVFVFVCEKV